MSIIAKIKINSKGKFFYKDWISYEKEGEV